MDSREVRINYLLMTGLQAMCDHSIIIIGSRLMLKASRDKYECGVFTLDSGQIPLTRLYTFVLSTNYSFLFWELCLFIDESSIIANTDAYSYFFLFNWVTNIVYTIVLKRSKNPY